MLVGGSAEGASLFWLGVLEPAIDGPRQAIRDRSPCGFCTPCRFLLH